MATVANRIAHWRRFCPSPGRQRMAARDAVWDNCNESMRLLTRLVLTGRSPHPLSPRPWEGTKRERRWKRPGVDQSGSITSNS